MALKMRNKYLQFVLVWLVMVSSVDCSKYATFETRSRLTVSEDGGYTDLVVAIGTTVVENPELVDSVKDVVTKFSRELYQLTG